MNPLSNMTYDFFMGQLRLIAVGVIAWLGGAGKLTTADASAATALVVPIFLLAGPYLWGVYRNLGMKLVPKDAIAVSPLIPGTSLATGDHVVIQDAKFPDEGTSQAIAKVVGALLFAFMLCGAINPSHAQVRLTGNPKADFAPRATAAPSTFDGAVASFHEQVQKVTKEVVDRVIIDLNAAIDDAKKHDDQISMPCWQANLSLFQSLPSQWENPPTVIGIALGIQIQRDLLNSLTGNDVKSLKVACAALWGDQLKIIANVGAMLGIRIATAGAL